MLKVSKLSLYITKELVKKILILTLGISILIFIIDSSELIKDAKDNNVAIGIALKIAILKLPTFIESSLQFILLLSMLFTFLKFSNNREILVMKMSELSIFQLLKFPVILVK